MLPLPLLAQHRAGEGRSAEWRHAHTFYFSYGCLVTWGLSELEERERLAMLSHHHLLLEALTEKEVDDFG